MRFSRVILLLKFCMKVAFSSFRGINHRKSALLGRPASHKVWPQLPSCRQSQKSSQTRPPKRPADTQMPPLQKLIPKLGICTLLLPKSPCEWPQRSAPRMRQMEEELRPSAACQQQKRLLPWERYHCACVCTQQQAPKPCFNFQSSSTAKRSYALVSLTTGCILLGAVKIDGLFVVYQRAYKDIVRMERLKIWPISFS